MNLGDCFHLPDFAGGHTNFVLEIMSDGSVITCNFTDYDHHADKTCVIEVGDHPSITKRSVVNFRKAEHCECGDPMDALLRLIDQKYKEPISADLLARIRKAALESPYTSDKIKEKLRKKR